MISAVERGLSQEYDAWSWPDTRYITTTPRCCRDHQIQENSFNYRQFNNELSSKLAKLECLSWFEKIALSFDSQSFQLFSSKEVNVVPSVDDMLDNDNELMVDLNDETWMAADWSMWHLDHDDTDLVQRSHPRHVDPVQIYVNTGASQHGHDRVPVTLTNMILEHHLVREPHSPLPRVQPRKHWCSPRHAHWWLYSHWFKHPPL